MTEAKHPKYLLPHDKVSLNERTFYSDDMPVDPDVHPYLTVATCTTEEYPDSANPGGWALYVTWQEVSGGQLFTDASVNVEVLSESEAVKLAAEFETEQEEAEEKPTYPGVGHLGGAWALLSMYSQWDEEAGYEWSHPGAGVTPWSFTVGMDAEALGELVPMTSYLIEEMGTKAVDRLGVPRVAVVLRSDRMIARVRWGGK